MTNGLEWMSVGASVLVVLVYEIRFAFMARREPTTKARSLHRLLRAAWVEAISKQAGSELLAVQALRNSLMSATITASTAALVLMGSLSLIVAGERASGLTAVSLRLGIEVALVLTLFAAYVCSALAMRYYHHAGFVLSLPVGSDQRTAREPLASAYVQQAGLLYSWSLRCFLFSAPAAVGLLSPFAMPLGAFGLVIMLALFDRVPPRVEACE